MVLQSTTVWKSKNTCTELSITFSVSLRSTLLQPISTTLETACHNRNGSSFGFLPKVLDSLSLKWDSVHSNTHRFFSFTHLEFFRRKKNKIKNQNSLGHHTHQKDLNKHNPLDEEWYKAHRLKKVQSLAAVSIYSFNNIFHTTGNGHQTETLSLWKDTHYL